jgi:serine/threonine protein kinase
MENKPNLELLEEVIENYEDFSYLDEGGFKAVYKARTIDGIEEAIKLIYIPRENDQPQINSEIYLRIKREIELLRLCECPYIVKLGALSPNLYEIQDRDYLIYSEELLDGKILHKRIEERHVPTIEELKTLLICLLKVVYELKQKELIHRDIKPKNIFDLSNSIRPFVVLDLGIAFKLHSTALTRNPDLRLGTLPYMAPEIFQPNFRQNFDFRSDLYSAGVTIYEYASGKHPITRRGENDYITIYRIAHLMPTPLNQHRSDLKESFCSLIDQFIRKIPALRPSNLEGLIRKAEAL